MEIFYHLKDKQSDSYVTNKISHIEKIILVFFNSYQSEIIVNYDFYNLNQLIKTDEVFPGDWTIISCCSEQIDLVENGLNIVGYVSLRSPKLEETRKYKYLYVFDSNTLKQYFSVFILIGKITYVKI